MAPRLNAAATGLVLCAAAEGRVWGHPKEDTTEYPTYEGFTLTLAEEFVEPLDLDNDPIWTWSDGGLREGLARFAKEQITFNDGKMRITAAHMNNVTRQTESCSDANAGTWATDQWALYSGELRTRRNQFRYGRYEVSMKAPSVRPNDINTNGNYIATMFAFKDANENNWREVDIEVTGDSPGSVTTNVFYANNQSMWSENIGAFVAQDIPGLNTRENFNIYAFEWLPTEVRWYLNGNHIRTYNASSASLNEFEGFNFTLTEVPALACKIMMSLWVGNPADGYSGDFGGSEHENNQYPFWVEYDWFRFYKWDADELYPCEDLHNPTCLTAVDMHRDKNNPCDGIEQVGIQCNADGQFCPRAALDFEVREPANPILLWSILAVVVVVAVAAGTYALYGTPDDDEDDDGVAMTGEGSIVL